MGVQSASRNVADLRATHLARPERSCNLQHVRRCDIGLGLVLGGLAFTLGMPAFARQSCRVGTHAAPLLVLTQESPWPESAPHFFVLYADGEVLYGHGDGQHVPKQLLRKTRLTLSDVRALMGLVPSGPIAKPPPGEKYHSVEDVTDLTWTVLTWWTGSERHQFAVYGPIQRETRAHELFTDIVVQASPGWFVDTFEKVASFNRPNSEPYEPSVIEVAVQPVPKGHLPGPAPRWPAEWPTLRSEGSVKWESGDGGIDMPASCKPSVQDFVHSLGPAPVFLLEGKKYLVRGVYDLLPGERSWGWDGPWR